MPEFKFDVTDEALEYMASSIAHMPGNEGQEYLTQQMIDTADAEAIVVVSIDGTSVDLESEYSISLTSPHPDAIQDIMVAAEQHFQEFAERAGDIMGLVDEAFKSL